MTPVGEWQRFYSTVTTVSEFGQIQRQAGAPNRYRRFLE